MPWWLQRGSTVNGKKRSWSDGEVSLAREVSQPGLAIVGVQSSGGAIFWHKCVRFMNEFDNNDEEVMGEVPVMKHIKQRDPFLRNKNSMGVQMMELSVGQQIIVAAEGGWHPKLQGRDSKKGKQRAGHSPRGKLIIPLSPNEVVEPPLEEASKKLMSKAMKAANKPKVYSSCDTIYT